DAKAKGNTLKASAAAVYLSEHLKLNYAEIFFGHRHRIGKELGKPLGSYAKKNALLHSKDQAFYERESNNGAHISTPLAAGIEMLKKRRRGSNYILLMTDGEETVGQHTKNLSELQFEAEQAGIHLLVLAMGDAQRYVPNVFKHYKF